MHGVQGSARLACWSSPSGSWVTGLWRCSLVRRSPRRDLPRSGRSSSLGLRNRLAGLVACIVVVAFWIYRVSAAPCVERRHDDLARLGRLAVHLMNLVRPYQGMREAWMPTISRQLAWRAAPAARLVVGGWSPTSWQHHLQAELSSDPAAEIAGLDIATAILNVRCLVRGPDAPAPSPGFCLPKEVFA